jgi:hypothetical protein
MIYWQKLENMNRSPPLPSQAGLVLQITIDMLINTWQHLS